jgi:hypothetical protein
MKLTSLFLYIYYEDSTYLYHQFSYFHPIHMLVSRYSDQRTLEVSFATAMTGEDKNRKAAGLMMRQDASGFGGNDERHAGGDTVLRWNRPKWLSEGQLQCLARRSPPLLISPPEETFIILR